MSGLDAQIEGRRLRLHVLIDTLGAGGAEFLLADPGSPTMVRDVKDPSALYVLMPMRV